MNTLTTSGSLEPLMVELVQRAAYELELSEFLADVSSGLDADFTPGAYLMLLIPLLEARGLAHDEYQFQAGAEVVDQEVARESLTSLLRQAAAAPANTEREAVTRFGVPNTVRTSISIIKAYWERFCNIPPFCSERFSHQTVSAVDAEGLAEE